MERSWKERAARARTHRCRLAFVLAWVAGALIGACAHATTPSHHAESGGWGGLPAIASPRRATVSLPSIDPMPMPPAQRRPWVRSGAQDVARAWVDATDALYGAGFADPRDLEYRYVGLDVGEASRAAGTIVYTEAFTFDAMGQHWAVAWNGVVYPVVLFGPLTPLDASARNALVPLVPFEREADSVRIERRTILAIPLLVRLGRFADASALASALSADNALALLEQAWTQTLVAHAVSNRMRDRHAEAAHDLGRLVTLATRLTTLARLDPFFAVAPILRDDEARRVREGAQRFDFAALDRLDSNARASLLVSGLGDVGPGVSREAYVDALVRAGPIVIDPLIEVIDHDDRITREMHLVGGPTRRYEIVTAADVAYDALVELLLVPTRHHPVNRWVDARDDAARRHAFAAQLRSYWVAAQRQ